MKISILTLFPEMMQGPFEHSIIKRAIEKKVVDIEYINIRDFGIGRHKIVDDKPYGGGFGMLLRVDVIDRALSHISRQNPNSHFPHPTSTRIILLDARGKTFTQEKAKELSNLDHLILICGHYEGVDERVKNLIDESISIGDYVLTGGELPAMVIVDSVVRLIPGVLTKPQATALESFSKRGYLEHPQYTKPRSFKGWEVPEILLSGNHRKIEEWKSVPIKSGSVPIKSGSEKRV